MVEIRSSLIKTKSESVTPRLSLVSSFPTESFSSRDFQGLRRPRSYNPVYHTGPCLCQKGLHRPGPLEEWSSLGGVTGGLQVVVNNHQERVDGIQEGITSFSVQ